jgi:hypothetical protein
VVQAWYQDNQKKVGNERRNAEESLGKKGPGNLSKNACLHLLSPAHPLQAILHLPHVQRIKGSRTPEVLH